MSTRRNSGALAAATQAVSGARSARPAPAAPEGEMCTQEASAWAGITGVWKPLYGSFFTQGVSVEWHDFTTERDIDWSRSFHPGSLEICLNFSGAARLQDGDAVRELPTGGLGIYTTRTQAPRATRQSGSLHRFLTLELTPAYLASQVGGDVELLKPALRRFVQEGGEAPPFLEVGALNTCLLSVRSAMVDPPVPATARRAWYQAKVLEVLTQTVFREEEPDELFCARHKRLNRDRVERVCYLLERDLENPPSLEMLATDVEVSPFYLSRMFAEEKAMSIPKFLRLRRMERAADLLKGGGKSVTEVAMQVGYASLSAFNRAFVEYAGCCPGLFPRVKIAGRTPRQR